MSVVAHVLAPTQDSDAGAGVGFAPYDTSIYGGHRTEAPARRPHGGSSTGHSREEGKRRNHMKPHTHVATRSRGQF